MKEFSVGRKENFAHFLSIREAILSPWRTGEYAGEGELGLCCVRSQNKLDPLEMLMYECATSQVWAVDARNSREGIGRVGVRELTTSALCRILWYYLNKGFVAPREEIIDRDDRLVKLVGVVFISSSEGVLLVPREGKNILPKSATVSVMESLRLDDIAHLFGIFGPYMGMTGDLPFKADEILSQLAGELSPAERIISRGIKEECPDLLSESLSLFRLVGGAKDLGLVWRCHVPRARLKHLRELHRGLIVKFGARSYCESLRVYGWEPDGWTEAILKFINPNV